MEFTPCNESGDKIADVTHENVSKTSKVPLLKSVKRIFYGVLFAIIFGFFILFLLIIFTSTKSSHNEGASWFQNFKNTTSEKIENFLVDQHLVAPITHSSGRYVNLGGGQYVEVYAERPVSYESFSVGNAKNKNETIKAAPNITHQIAESNAKVYPVQHNNLWGYEFYTSNIDESGDTDIGSEEKQRIVRLLKKLNFPTALTKNLIFVYIDPTITQKIDHLAIPWLNRSHSVALQPEGGTFQTINKGAVIAINSSIGKVSNTRMSYEEDVFNRMLLEEFGANKREKILVHELGHLIGSQLTELEWGQFYQLRGIPSGTPKKSENWNESPTEDFAEVYKNISGYGDVMTLFGLLVENKPMSNDMFTPCREIRQKLEKEWRTQAEKEDPIGYLEDVKQDMQNAMRSDYKSKVTIAIESNTELQTCRAENLKGKLGLNYVSEVNESTKNFIKNVVDRLK